MNKVNTCWGYKPEGRTQARIKLLIKVIWMDRPDFSIEFAERHLMVPVRGLRGHAEAVLDELEKRGESETWQAIRLMWSLESGLSFYDWDGFRNDVNWCRKRIGELFSTWKQEPDAMLKIEFAG